MAFQGSEIDIFNSLLLLSLLLAVTYRKIIYSNCVLIGSLRASASASDSKSNELKMSNSHSTRCIGLVLVFSSSFYQNVTFLL